MGCLQSWLLSPSCWWGRLGCYWFYRFCWAIVVFWCWRVILDSWRCWTCCISVVPSVTSFPVVDYWCLRLRSIRSRRVNLLFIGDWVLWVVHTVWLVIFIVFLLVDWFFCSVLQAGFEVVYFFCLGLLEILFCFRLFNIFILLSIGWDVGDLTVIVYLILTIWGLPLREVILSSSVCFHFCWFIWKVVVVPVISFLPLCFGKFSVLDFAFSAVCYQVDLDIFQIRLQVIWFTVLSEYLNLFGARFLSMRFLNVAVLLLFVDRFMLAIKWSICIVRWVWP